MTHDEKSVSEREAEEYKPPFLLTREGSSKAVAQACGMCGRVYALNDAYANRCCNRRCEDCDTPLPKKFTWTCCDPCRGKRDAKREADAIAKAKRVPEAEYQGPVYYDGAWNEGYCRDLDEFREWWDDEQPEGTPYPAEVWGCSVRRHALPSADRLIEDMCSDAHESAYDNIMGAADVAELQTAIDAFNASVTEETWEPANIRVVLSPPATQPTAPTPQSVVDETLTPSTGPSDVV